MTTFDVRWEWDEAEAAIWHQSPHYYIDDIEVDVETFRRVQDNTQGRYTAPHYQGQYHGPGKMNAWLPGGKKWTGALTEED